jgi:hypothetical protein
LSGLVNGYSVPLSRKTLYCSEVTSSATHPRHRHRESALGARWRCPHGKTAGNGEHADATQQKRPSVDHHRSPRQIPAWCLRYASLCPGVTRSPVKSRASERHRPSQSAISANRAGTVWM